MASRAPTVSRPLSPSLHVLSVSVSLSLSLSVSDHLPVSFYVLFRSLSRLFSLPTHPRTVPTSTICLRLARYT